MTTDELVGYYTNLLILQYNTLPKAKATIDGLVRPVIMDQLPLLVQAAYAVDTAVGVQLDVLGKYVGVSRNTYDFSGPISLSDTDFRVLIRLAITNNNSGSSLYDIQNVIHIFFASALQVFDYANMQMDYFFDTSIGSNHLAEVFVKQKLLPKPMGVQLGSLIYVPNVTNIFGFRTYVLAQMNISPFNSYSTYHTDWTWISYSNAIVE